MSARDLFGVGLRLLALWIGYTGLQYVLSWISLSMGDSLPHQDSRREYLLSAVVYSLTGLALFVGAPTLEGIAYGQPLDAAEDAPLEEELTPPETGMRIASACAAVPVASTQPAAALPSDAQRISWTSSAPIRSRPA